MSDNELKKLNTSHSHFLIPSTDPSYPPVSVLLRGVNLSSTSKFPNFAKSASSSEKSNRTERDSARLHSAGLQTHLGVEGSLWDEAERGGDEGWFVGHPFDLDATDVHLKRLRSWGFNAIRLVVTWEALEHAGPGKYDESYIDYVIQLLQKCKQYGLRVYISSHQDVFSRFLSGSGAPMWVLLAAGLAPRRVHQTGAAVIHACWKTQGWGGEEGAQDAQKDGFADFPDMIWNTNLHRLASRHCFTMFYASEVFAPKCQIDGQPVGVWLRERYNNAYGRLADRIAASEYDLLDTCLIGWDSVNEPHEGFIGMPVLDDIPPSQEFRKGPSPSPIQGFRLGMGQSVTDIAYDDFTSFGHKKVGTVTMTPPEGHGVWLTREESDQAARRWGWTRGADWDFWSADGNGGCPWAGHGVWDPSSGRVLKNDYFLRKPDGGEYQFIGQFWRDHYVSFISRIRQSFPSAISFINPPIFAEPPDLSEHVKQGRMALSSHFYDGLTMLGKRRHRFNADAVGLQRGHINMLQAIKFGSKAIKDGIQSQFSELKSDAHKQGGIASDQTGMREYPTIIGELGVPFDMKKSGLLGLAKGKTDRKDYKEPSRAMDELLNGCDGENTLSYTLWDYEPTNTHANGDGWNGEDLSLFSYDEMEKPDDDLHSDNPADLQSLIELGSRGIQSWCRPYPVEAMGRVKSFTFNMETSSFDLRVDVISLEGSRLWQAEREKLNQTNAPFDDGKVEGSVLIYLPFIHYLGVTSSVSSDDAGAKNGAIHSVNGKKRVTGLPNESMDDWIHGQGSAIVDIEVLEISEGRLEVHGQYARWYYPLQKKGEREIHLKLQKWAA